MNFMKEILKMINLMEKEFINGQKINFVLEIGKIIF